MQEILYADFYVLGSISLYDFCLWTPRAGLLDPLEIIFGETSLLRPELTSGAFGEKSLVIFLMIVL